MITLVLLTGGITSYIIISRSYQTNYLAIASDVIQCAEPSLLYQYNNIVVNETPSDPVNDNPEGLIMDLFTLKEKDIKYRTYLDNRNHFELVLPITGANRFIMPYNYYNRPWYLWAGSTIDITYQIKCNKRPAKAILYLFKGEKMINLFFFREEIDS